MRCHTVRRNILNEEGVTISTSRRQTVQQTQVTDLERLLLDGPGPDGEIPLCYALAREFEDLGQYARSFAYLKRGADARRRQLDYRVEMDESAIAEIVRVFDAPLLERAPQARAGAGPIFIVGLPRTGTTLVDRILSSHSEVSSLGEINDLPLALTRAADEAPRTPGVAKESSLQRTSQADFAALGADYLRRIAGYGAGKAFLIDKTPLNFLHIGLIRLSMPTAKILHLSRHPLDSGYAMYKTLFRAGYPFSYDLSDVGRYYLAYHRLMDHWRSHLPEGFLDVHYEDLVRDPEVQSRRIVDWCGLEWQPQCLAFHSNPSPAAAASEGQVREPLHSRSVGLWTRYRMELQPLSQVLAPAGLDYE
ncbi:MAG: sulfotransferase [Gammaproteobacteria bacterium]